MRYVGRLGITCLLTLLWLTGVFVSFGVAQALPNGTGQSEHARLTLHVDTATLQPGQPFWAAVAFDIAKDWHIYWQNPGDSGLSAELNWQLPDGFSAGAIHWPTPERIAYSGLVNYGYEGQTALLVPITAPDPLPRHPVTLELHAEYLICKDICIPESASLSHTIDPTHSAKPANGTALTQFKETLPEAFHDTARYDIIDDRVMLAFDLGRTAVEMNRIYDAVWFPLDERTISNAAQQEWRFDESVLILSTRRDGSNLPKPFRGVLSVKTTDGQSHDFSINADYAPAGASEPVTLRLDDIPQTEAVASSETNPSAPRADAPPLHPTPMNGLIALAFAFLGGLILNVMPCVLPVLSLKALSIARKSGSATRQMRLEGVAYTAGILCSFMLIAGLLIALQQAGASIGWGFQLQSVGFVSALIYILFLVGLNLSGAFELQTSVGAGGTLAEQGGLSGSFFTGVLAAVVATPCTAPFMATAIGYALAQPATLAMLIFLALGLGLAFPFLLITWIPQASRLLPKPGSWMLRFKQLLAFPIYGTVIWLLWVLTQQTGSLGMLSALCGLLLLTFTLWLVSLTGRRLVKISILFAALAALIVLTEAIEPITASDGTASHNTQSEPFSQSTLQAYREEGRPVFVNATADWCITCKANERIALKTERVQNALEQKNIAYLVADWTNRNDEIAAYLQSFGRSGVPMYVYYPPKQPPVLLPQLLTPATVLNHLDVPQTDTRNPETP